jgi:hypothetical protein
MEILQLLRLGKVWTLRISIPNALNVGLTFNQFSLSSIAEMYVYNDATTTLKGVIKSEHFTVPRPISIAPLKGNAIIIYILERNNFSSFQSNILIQKLVAGFQEVDDVGDAGGQSQRASVNCNPHVICQPGRMMSARAVARTSMDGHLCTGTLLNNELNNGRAFFLTAFHCIDNGGGIFGWEDGEIDADEEAALANMVFQFQFWRTECNGNVNNTFVEFSGAVLRAQYQNSDMVLLELIDPPGIGDGVNYAGWSRQTNAPSENGSFILHHPEGVDMRVTSTRTVNHFLWNNFFWTAHYSSGTVAGGSSGAALFNEFNQVVGQLKGGWSNCNHTTFGDRYGKFYHSWNNGGLQDWLSPVQGLQNTSILQLSPLTIAGSGTILCTTPTQYSVPGNLLGCTYNWTVSSNLQITSGQGTGTVMVAGNPNASNQNGTIQVTITDSKGRNRVATATLNVFIGMPTPSYVLTPLEGDFCQNQLYEAIGSSSVSGISYNWTVNGVLDSYHGYKLKKRFPANTTTISLTVSNAACGNSAATSQTFICSSGRFIVSPNPSGHNIKVKAKDIASFINIRIVDKLGNVKKDMHFPANSKLADINISNLPVDIYSVQIFDGISWSAILLSVKR